MIQEGDKFSVIDLRTSIDEVLAAQKSMPVHGGTPPLRIVIDGEIMDILRCSPHMYAQYRINQYNDIKSSAINIDTQLRKNGFYTTHKFSYDYRTPGLTPEQIINDAYCMEYFQTMANAAQYRRKSMKQFEPMLRDAFRISYYYAQYLWACNPGVCTNIAKSLSCPGADNWGQIIAAILGVGFKFHPDDVYEFAINHISPDITPDEFNARYDMQKHFKDTVMKKYAIDTGCMVLSENSQQKLTQILTKSEPSLFMQIISKLRFGNKR